MHGNTIKGECKDMAGHWHPTTLNHATTCGRIENMNGNLVCGNRRRRRR